MKEVLLTQPVLHVDETGFYYEGRRNWLHTICTDKYSFYATHTKRGSVAMHDMGVLPNYKGRLVHDFWKPYNEFGCRHSLCNVHHLRDLTFCHQIEQGSWVGHARQLRRTSIRKWLPPLVTDRPQALAKTSNSTGTKSTTA